MKNQEKNVNNIQKALPQESHVHTLFLIRSIALFSSRET